MNLKKVVASLFSLGLVLSPMSIYAEDYDIVAVSSDYEYAYKDYNSAWTDANNGIEILMLQDWDISGRLVVDEGKSVTIDMNGHKIDRHLSEKQSDGEVIYMNKNSNLTLKGSTDNSFEVKDLWKNQDGSRTTYETTGGLVTGGYSTNGGGGIHMKKNSKLTLDHVGVMSNIAQENSASGGAIFTETGCEVSLKNQAKIAYNYAARNGGAIFVNGEDTYIYMDNSRIFYNIAQTGGAILSDADATRITMDNNSRIEDNKATLRGGALYFRNSYGLVQSNDGTGVFYNNIAESATDCAGGAIFFQPASGEFDEAEVKNVTFYYNQAISTSSSLSEGGAISGNLANIDIINCTFTENSAGEGGALYVYNDNITLDGCTMSENRAKKGGAVYVDSQFDLNLAGKCKIKGNKKSNGSSADDIYLDVGYFTRAYVSGTPDEGSQVGLIGIGACKVGINQTADNGSFFLDESDQYDLEYSGSELNEKSKTTGSIFGNGNTIIAGCVMLGIGVVGVVILVVNKKKMKA